MALSESTVIGHIGILPDGQLQIRQDTVITRDGVEVSRAYHRHVISPGEDVSGEDPRVQAVAKAIHTRPVVDAYIGAAIRETD